MLAGKDEKGDWENFERVLWPHLSSFRGLLIPEYIQYLSFTLESRKCEQKMFYHQKLNSKEKCDKIKLL